MSEQTPVSPWFRQPWFWFLLIFPTAAIIWCIFMITMAVTSQNSMVTDDYSKEGRGINMELARDEKAVELGLQAQLDFAERTVQVNLEGNSGASNYPYLVLNLFHPTLEDRDLTVQLMPVNEHAYSGNLPSGTEGRWYLDLRGPDNDWRLKGETELPSSTTLELGVTLQGQG
ncbi:FixH family protein [Marinobacter zhejiangensis]|uniref:Nitrogen fixation protein FixH n=1 Tax=Marinobacter zhejiangensis TaxID=488535 RepID=A0A1I4RFP8_9GAMM|nr:FixH family protein [Marinobacter zhejiangensis]SFM51045.1 hypothetical protein SAMN04487963_2734 [Marinobacter zhejiangensis]